MRIRVIGINITHVSVVIPVGVIMITEITVRVAVVNMILVSAVVMGIIVPSVCV